MKSIGAKLMIGFGLVIMLVCMGVGYIASLRAGQALHQTAVENLMNRAEDSGKLVINDLESNLSIVETITTHNVIANANWNEKLPELIKETQRLNFKHMGIATLDGVLRSSDGTLAQIGAQKYFKQALGGEKNFSGPIRSDNDNSMTIVLAAPIEREEQITGVLIGVEDAGILSRFTNDIVYGDSGYSFILSEDGTILAHPDASRLYKKYDDLTGVYTPEVNDFINRMILGGRGYGQYTLADGAVMIAGYAPIDNTGWTVAVAAEKEELLAGVMSLQRWIAIASVFAIVLGLLLAFKIGRTISLPINLITAYYRKTAEGDFSRRLDSTWTGRKDELGALALGYNMINFNIGQIVDRLAQSEQKLRQITDNMTDLISRTDRDGRLEYVSPSHFAVTGWQPEELIGIYAFDLHHPDDRGDTMEVFKESRKSGQTGRIEFRFKTKQGTYKWLEGMGKAIYDDGGEVIGGLITAREIEDRKKAETEIRYMADHDSLTELYNRSFFERKIIELDDQGIVPVAILVCDVDGLKLVNDTLGHSAGDRLLLASARLFRNTCPREATVFRTGGDEFAILLPGYNDAQINDLFDSLRRAIKEFNAAEQEMPISISMGYAIRFNPQEKLTEVFKKADQAMYREKLTHSRSTRSAIVEVVMRALEARDYITEGHGDRLQEIVTAMGESIGMHEYQINDLCLFARFHDIGKVGVPDRILFKAGKLTAEEFDVMKKHCEIGYRIAQSSPDFLHIADWILIHHEWWDGNGYPLGLRGGEIPLQCRVLAIADAFDAMRNDRPYREAKDLQEIKLELRKCAGSQFDPILVEYFLSILETRDFS